MASATFPPNTTFVDEWRSKDGESLGKPKYAEVTRAFTIDGDANLKAVLAQVVDAAEDAGWSGEYGTAPATISIGWAGTKSSPRGEMSLSIAISVKKRTMGIFLDSVGMDR